MQKGRGRVSKGARPGKRANKETRGEESTVRNGERKEIGFLKKKKREKRWKNGQEFATTNGVLVVSNNREERGGRVASVEFINVFFEKVARERLLGFLDIAPLCIR